MKKDPEIFLGIPRAKVSEREWRAARYRWEFLRLNPDYERDYKRSKKNAVAEYHPKWGVAEWLGPDLSFDELYKKIVTIHASDVLGKEGFEYSAIGKGAVDFKGIFGYLKKRGFNGWICMEEASNKGIEGIREAAQFIRNLWTNT